jgi:hypothetical protein
MANKLFKRHGIVGTVAVKRFRHFDTNTMLVAFMVSLDIIFFNIIPGTIFITEVTVDAVHDFSLK